MENAGDDNDMGGAGGAGIAGGGDDNVGGAGGGGDADVGAASDDDDVTRRRTSLVPNGAWVHIKRIKDGALRAAAGLLDKTAGGGHANVYPVLGALYSDAGQVPQRRLSDHRGLYARAPPGGVAAALPDDEPTSRLKIADSKDGSDSESG